MTIYTSKGNDKKEEEAIFPQVVTDVLVSYFDDLVQVSKTQICLYNLETTVDLP